MKNSLCLFVFLFAFGNLLGQDYERVDATIALYPERFERAEDLSRLISRDFISEKEKIRAMYSWIIHNVVYDPDEYKKFNYNFKDYRERNQKEEKTRRKVIERTLQEGVAVCEGYAMLFEKLCQLQGIQNYLVRGDIKTNFEDIGRPFRKIHMWNVVLIEGEPILIDATWGAGRYNGKFIKDPTYFYFNTPPHLFIKNHYPELYEDTFLDELISREVFSNWPLIIRNDLELDAVERPFHGVISSASDDGNVQFALRLKDEVQLSYSYGNERISIEAGSENNVTTFVIPLELGAKRLLIYFNDEPALGYKID